MAVPIKRSSRGIPVVEVKGRPGGLAVTEASKGIPVKFVKKGGIPVVLKKA